MPDSIEEFLRQSLPVERYDYYPDDSDVYELIVQDSAQADVQSLAGELETQINEKLLSLLERALAPRLEVRHVREEGLRIWGKADNVAFAKPTLVSLLDMIRDLVEPAAFAQGLQHAGQRAALGFFDHFRSILRKDGRSRIPRSVSSFMEVLGQFDIRSGWWDRIEFEDEGGESLSVAARRPFWRYPFTDANNHLYSHFAGGYLLALHNACFDYLSVMARLANAKFDERLAVEVRIFEDLDTDTAHLRLERAAVAVESFSQVSATLFVLAEWLLSDATVRNRQEDILKLVGSLIDDFETTFGTPSVYTHQRLDETRIKIKNFTPESVRQELSEVLLLLRVQFDDLRIQALQDPEK